MNVVDSKLDLDLPRNVNSFPTILSQIDAFEKYL